MLVYIKESGEPLNFDPKPEDLNIIEVPIEVNLKDRSKAYFVTIYKGWTFL